MTGDPTAPTSESSNWAQIPAQRPEPTAVPRDGDDSWQLPILMYHSVPHHSPETAVPGTMPVSLLAEQLAFLTVTGWHVVGITEALRLVRAESSRRVLALTFDDGLLDFVNALDVLAGFGARATVYVPTDGVGIRVSRWGRGHSKLGWEQLAEIREAGIEVGSQSISGRPLDVQRDDLVRWEVLGSKRRLEDRLGGRVDAFCYPYGLSVPRVRAAVADAGYENACTISPRPARSSDDVFDLPRLRLHAGMTGENIDRFARGSGESVRSSFHCATAPAWQMARRSALRAIHTALPRT